MSYFLLVCSSNASLIQTEPKLRINNILCQFLPVQYTRRGEMLHSDWLCVNLCHQSSTGGSRWKCSFILGVRDDPAILPLRPRCTHQRLRNFPAEWTPRALTAGFKCWVFFTVRWRSLLWMLPQLRWLLLTSAIYWYLGNQYLSLQCMNVYDGPIVTMNQGLVCQQCKGQWSKAISCSISFSVCSKRCKNDLHTLHIQHFIIYYYLTLVLKQHGPDWKGTVLCLL